MRCAHLRAICVTGSEIVIFDSTIVTSWLRRYSVWGRFAMAFQTRGNAEVVRQAPRQIGHGQWCHQAAEANQDAIRKASSLLTLYSGIFPIFSSAAPWLYRIRKRVEFRSIELPSHMEQDVESAMQCFLLFSGCAGRDALHRVHLQRCACVVRFSLNR